MKTTDYRDCQRRVTDAVGKALTTAKVQYRVSLSSLGADKSEGMGPVVRRPAGRDSRGARRMKRLDCLRSFAAIALVCVPAWAQETASATKSSKPAPPAKEWSFYASVFGYVIPRGRSYVAPVVSADRRSLHIETRYNYESLETGSFWLGRNFSGGSKMTLELTPMIGGVFGKSNGVAPGYLASLGYRRLSLDSQGEYLFDRERSKSFFYNWSEISYSPAEWFRAGIVAEFVNDLETPARIN
jgi:hypothetical protein